MREAKGAAAARAKVLKSCELSMNTHLLGMHEYEYCTCSVFMSVSNHYLAVFILICMSNNRILFKGCPEHRSFPGALKENT